MNPSSLSLLAKKPLHPQSLRTKCAGMVARIKTKPYAKPATDKPRHASNTKKTEPIDRFAEGIQRRNNDTRENS